MTEASDLVFDRALTWLREVGLDIDEDSDPPGTKDFIRGIRLRPGGITLHHSAEITVADLLHESAHIAITPRCFWPTLEPGSIPGPSMFAAIETYRAAHEFCDDLGNEDPTYRAILQMGEDEAIAWSYAATTEIGIDPRVLIHPRSDGSRPFEEQAEDVLCCLEIRQFYGIHGLQAAGFCDARQFPKMRKWLA